MSQDPSSRSTNPYAAPEGEAELDDAAHSVEQRVPWTTLVGLGIGQGVAFGLLWSVFMSLAMRWDFVGVLLGPGLFCGISFGTFMAIYFAIAMRPTAVTISFEDQPAFLEELESRLKKLRYGKDEVLGDRLYFSPRTPIRPKAFSIAVELRPGSALIVGPRANLNALKKHLERQRSGRMF